MRVRCVSNTGRVGEEWRWKGQGVWFWVGVIFEEIVGNFVRCGYVFGYGLKRMGRR